MFSLNGSTLSSKGRKPSKQQYSNPNQTVYKLKQFKYDEQLLRYVYHSFSKENNEGPELAYTVDLKQQGTINLFIKPEETTLTTTRTIFSLINQTNDVVFNLFMDYTSRLRFSLLGATHGTTHTLNPSVWHMVTLVWEQNQIKIYVNRQLVHQQIVSAFDFTDTTFYIGSRGDTYYPFRHLEGYVEMVSVWGSALTTGDLEKLYTEGLPITFESKLDSKGRLVGNAIHGLQNTMTKTYVYNDEVFSENNEHRKKLGKVPVSEVSIDGTKINYTYDEHYNVVEKLYLDLSDKPTKVVYYTYDGLKRLSKEIVNHVTMDMTNPNEPIRIETCMYAYEFSYDQNSNIVKKTRFNGTQIDYGDTYIYDKTIKDRLNRITRLKNNQTTTQYELTYDQNHPFWPSQFIKDNTNYQLLWQGPRLMSLGNYQYQYNEKGIRVKKTGGGVNIKYDLDGQQVVRSTNLINNKSIRYHFDQNNQLIGLNYSGKEYVYARNLLGEIYGIMDLKGKSIIRYTYNAYGVPSITLGTNLSSSETLIASDIAELNIYLYKGYIYDQETKLYYCKSRYYDPEVGRWLSIDHIAYLDVESIGGLNLYAYCGNNPVMYLDSDGNFPQWLKWTIGGVIIIGLGVAALTIGGAVIIGASIGAIVGTGVGLMSGVKLDENGLTFDWDRAATGFMFGSITGAISGAFGAKINGMSNLGTFAQRSIMAGIDGTLSLGAYLGQAGIHGDSISLGGALISFGSALFSFAEPTGYKVLDAIWGPILGAEIAWVYDVFNKFNKNQNVSTVRLTPYF